MTVVDSAVYVQGVRTADPESLDETFEVMRERQGLAWIGLYRPDPEELHRVADEFGLHPLAVEDALSGHQRSKMERYGDTWFEVLRPARYVDADERVEFGAMHVFVGPDFGVTIRHAESPDLVATGTASRRTASSSRSGRAPSCTRSSTRSSTSTAPSRRASRTTSTRSRTRSSAPTPTSPAASTR